MDNFSAITRISRISLLKSNTFSPLAFPWAENKTPLAANKRGFCFYSLTFCQFAEYRAIRLCEQTAFFSKIFCLSVDPPAHQRTLLVTTNNLTVTVI